VRIPDPHEDLFKRKKFVGALIAHALMLHRLHRTDPIVYYYRMTIKRRAGWPTQEKLIERKAIKLGMTATNLMTPEGYLGRQIDGSTVSVPDTIRLSGDQIVWSARTAATAVRRVDVDDRMLERFLALATPERDNQDVLEFARDFGPLWLCEDHGFVAFHQPLETMGCAVLPEIPNAPHFAARMSLICLPRQASSGLFSEPIAQWRALAANANKLLDAAASMHRGAQVTSETWREIDGLAPDHPIAKHLSDPRARLAENLNRWLEISDVRFHVGLEGGSIRPQLGANAFSVSVLALIALQLVAATVRASALAHCSACSRLFFLSASQPAPGKRIGHAIAKRIYCSTCRAAGVPARDAAQASRDRKKAAAAARKPTKGEPR